MYTKEMPGLGGASFEEWEAWIISQTLDFWGGNITETAKSLKLGRATLHRLINKYGLKAR